MLAAYKEKKERKIASHEPGFFRAIIENLASGVLIIDCQGRLTFLNPAGEKILGVNQDEIQMMSLDEIMTPIDEEHNPILLTLYNGEAIHRRKFRILTKTGREILLGLSAVPLRNKAKELKGVGVIFADLTEQEAMEKEQQKLQHLAQLGEMTSWIAHEFKNPLTSIRLGVTTLKERLKISEQDEKFLEMILTELDRMNSTLREILCFSRPVKFEELRSCPIYEIIQHALFIMCPQLEQANIGVELDCPDPTIKALCEPRLLEQVFINLITNALQAMSGGGRLRIELNRSQKELKRKPSVVQNLVEISFIDSGVGIPPEDLERIFEAFYTTKRYGTGLGLAIARKVVEEVGGEILVQSKPGIGSAFIIRLLAPADKEHNPKRKKSSIILKQNLPSYLFSPDRKSITRKIKRDGPKKNIDCR